MTVLLASPTDLFDEYCASSAPTNPDVLAVHVQKMKEMNAFYSLSSTYTYLLDLPSKTYPFVGKGIGHHLGLDPETMRAGGLAYWLDRLHPEETSVWVIALAGMLVYTAGEFEPGEQGSLTYSWNIRVRGPRNRCFNVMEQMRPLAWDAEGKPTLVKMEGTVIGEDEVLPVRTTIKRLNEEGRFEFVRMGAHPQKSLTDSLTDREKDVARMLAERKSSKEIADTLCISPHTVDTHRRRILRKLGIGSTGELFAYCQRHWLN